MLFIPKNLMAVKKIEILFTAIRQINYQNNNS